MHLNNRHFLTAAVAVLLCASTLTARAQAGTFEVDGTCGAWTAIVSNPSRFDVRPECPQLIARNAIGNFRTRPGGPANGWVFNAAPGTTIRAANISSNFRGGPSWAAIAEAIGPGPSPTTLQQCGGPFGNRCGDAIPLANNLPDSSAIRVAVYCIDTDPDGCPNSGPDVRGDATILNSKITLADPSAPAAEIVGGSAVAGGWVGGTRTLAIKGTDNTGIRAVRAVVDGNAGATASLACDYSKVVPCGSADGAEAGVDLRSLPDGAHQVAAQTEDASGNPGTSGPTTINVDNTPPTRVSRLRPLGGDGWSQRNSFAVTWTNPAQQFAPIVGVNYEICPEGQPLGSPGCKGGSADGADVSQLAFDVPGPGAWTIAVWPRDQAGNQSREQAVRLTGIGLLANGSKTKLKVGKKLRSRKHGKLKRTVTVRRGRGVTVRGRLTGRRGNGFAAGVLVYRRTSIQGANYRRVARIKSGARGRFRYRARAGTSRRLLFVYPGGNGRRGRTSSVNVRVRTKLTLNPDRRNLRNGETVVLSGRLAGGKIPPNGALLEIQVFTRGRWRPFATPRTDPKGGWTQPYRFETVSGTAKFRFRAVLRKQPTYPFIARSRPTPVRVRGA